MSDAVLKENDELRLQRDCALTRLERLEEAWGDYVDPRGYLTDDPTFGYFPGGSGRSVAFTSLDDRKDGRFRPVYETEAELAASRAAARNLALTTGVRTGALDALANYTLGSGFTFEAQPENDTDRVSLKLAQVVQKIIDRFVDDNDFAGLIDRECHLRSREDGECFLAFDEQEIRETGKVLVEFIEPDQVTEPANPRVIEDWVAEEYPDCCISGPSCWKFGVHTPEGKTAKPLGYNVIRNSNGTDWDYYPASRVEHIKRNVTRNAKRGVSDFFEVVSDLVKEAKLRRNMSDGAALQSAIAWILQGAPGQTQSQLSSVGGESRRTDSLPSPLGPNASSTIRNASHYPAGTVLKVGNGQVYLPGPMGAERNAGFELVGQYALRAIGIRWSFPEYIISGDASNGNYASTLVAESPFVKAREADQQFYKRHFLSLLWKVVRIYVESSALERYGIHRDNYAQLLNLVRIECECPTVASRDPKVAVDSDKVLVDGGIMSKQTWAARNSLDYEKEQKLGALEKPPEPAPFSPFGAPVPQPESKQPQQPEAQQDQQPPDQTKQAAVSAALESVETTEEAHAILETLSYP